MTSTNLKKMKIIPHKSLSKIEGALLDKKKMLDVFLMSPLLANIEHEYNGIVNDTLGIDRKKCNKTCSYKDFLITAVTGLPFLILKDLIEK
jgi:hypothetical protein